MTVGGKYDSEGFVETNGEVFSVTNPWIHGPMDPM